jgi:hypothetical protein
MSSFYNELLLLQEASKVLAKNVDQALLALCNLLAKFHLDAHFGIILVHRHFELGGDEQMVDLPGEAQITVTSVFKNGRPDSHVVGEYKLEIPSSPAIVPTSFIVRNAKLLQYEFSYIPEDDAGSYADLVTHINSRFRKEWVETLQRFEMVDRFGITTLGGGRPGLRCEESYTEKRVSVLRMVNEIDTALIPTVWYSDNGAPRVCNRCGH